MATAQKAQPASRLPAKTTDWRESITGKGSGQPTRCIIHAPEGVGKTSFAAQAPNPIFVMSETGLLTLIDNLLVPEIDHFPEAHSWADVMSQIDWLCNADTDHQTLVLDTLNGIERFCHEHVCRRDFNNDWGDKGFTSFHKGYDVALADWLELLFLLDNLRAVRNMSIICLCHTQVRTFQNPEGPDFDRYQPDMHRKTWGLTHKWADLVGFMNFETFAQKEKGADSRHKGKGGQSRMLYVERHAAYDAKNRHGLTGDISMGSSPAEAWVNFTSTLKAGRNSNGKVN